MLIVALQLPTSEPRVGAHLCKKGIFMEPALTCILREGLGLLNVGKADSSLSARLEKSRRLMASSDIPFWPLKYTDGSR